MRAIGQGENSPSHGGGERETPGWLYARRSVTQARWATAPLSGGNPPNGVAARHSVPSRFSPKKTGNGRGLRAHWRENLCISLVAIAPPRLCESVRCLGVVGILSSFLDRWTISRGYHSFVTFLLSRARQDRICDSDLFCIKKVPGKLWRILKSVQRSYLFFPLDAIPLDYYRKGWECKV